MQSIVRPAHKLSIKWLHNCSFIRYSVTLKQRILYLEHRAHIALHLRLDKTRKTNKDYLKRFRNDLAGLIHSGTSMLVFTPYKNSNYFVLLSLVVKMNTRPIAGYGYRWRRKRQVLRNSL